MNPGDLRTSVQIQGKTITGHDTIGQPVFTWTTIATYWAKDEDAPGRETWRYWQMQAEAQGVLVMHYPAVTIKRDMRALAGTRVLNILDARDPDGDKRRRFFVAYREWVE